LIIKLITARIVAASAFATAFVPAQSVYSLNGHAQSFMEFRVGPMHIG
jgi:hypothetical protein